MELQRQHFLLSYSKILSVDPAGVRTRDLLRDSSKLNQLSHRCAVDKVLGVVAVLFSPAEVAGLAVMSLKRLVVYEAT